MLNKSKRWILGGVALLAVPALMLAYSQRAQSSDHGDTIFTAQTNPAADLTDLYIFPKPGDANTVVLVMNTHGLLSPAQTAGASFDPNVLYEFKIDTTPGVLGDKVDKVIQAKFTGTGPNQTVQISGPVAPSSNNATTSVQEPVTATGPTRDPVGFTGGGLKVFAGPRADSFFFDIQGLCEVLPDRCQPFKSLLPMPVPKPAQPNKAMATDFNLPSTPPRDILDNFNVMSIVIEVPKAQLSTGKIGVWMTTSTS